MTEFSIILLLFVTGLGFVRLFLANNYPVFNAASAFPCGVSIWVVCYIVIYILPLPINYPLPFNVYLTFSVYCITAAVIFLINLIRWKVTSRETFLYAFSIIILFIIYKLTTDIPFFALTGDSLHWLDITRGFQGSLQRGYPIFNQCVQGLSLLIGADYILTTVPQFFTVSIAGIMAYVAFGEITSQTRAVSFIYRGYILFLSLLPVLILFSPYAGMIQIFYFNHHMIAATLIFLFAASFWLAIRKNSPSAIYIGIFALVMFTLTRMEGLLFSTVILFIFLGDPEISEKQQRNAGIMFLCGVIPWHLYVIAILKHGAKLVSWQQVSIMLCLSIAAGVSFQANRWSIGRYILPYTDYMALTGLLGGFGVFITLKPQHMTESFGNLVKNLYYNSYGGWGGLWSFVTISSVMLLIFSRKSQRSRFMDRFFITWIASILLILDITFLRSEPLELGNIMYSTNRINFHFAPLILVWVFSQLQFFSNKRSSG